MYYLTYAYLIHGWLSDQGHLKKCSENFLVLIANFKDVFHIFSLHSNEIFKRIACL